MKSVFALTMLAFSTAATAQAPAPVAPPAAAAVMPPPAVLPAAKPAAPKKARVAKAPAAPNPNLVEAKTASGKTVHYDCSKPGNKTKTACKK